jgi:serine/threonine-protein kinase
VGEPIFDRRIGTVLGESYRLERLIGEGGMGRVYEATHLRLSNKRFAVKLLHLGADDDSSAYARFRREAEIATRIGHPHIIEVVDFNITEDGQPFMVMELLEGQDLHRCLEEVKRLEKEELIPILGQVADALQAAHDAGVVHRDLKPGNIFLTRGVDDDVSVVKLLDFGLSKIRHARSQVTREKAVFGTPYYMSPEQAGGDANRVDHRADIFALAIIAYRCITGRLPFDAPTGIGVLYQVVHADPPALTRLAKDLSRQVDRVMARALAKEPGDRHPSVRAFADDLIRALRAPPETEVLSPETAEQLQLPTAQRWSKKQLGVLVLMTFSALMIGAGVAITWLALPSETEKPPPPQHAVSEVEPLKKDAASLPLLVVRRVDSGQDVETLDDLAAPRPAKPRRAHGRKPAKKKKRIKRKPQKPRRRTKKPPVRYDNL